MTLPVTYLFVPADRPERFAKALASGADRAILDLEDAVRPEAKPAAREAVRGAALDWLRVVIRINDAATPFFTDDLAVIAAAPAGAVMVPKAETAEALARVRRAARRDVELIPQIETARGLANLPALLAAPGVRRVAFGHLDFALDLGCAPDWEALTLARQTVVLQSRMAGAAPPIESVTADIADTDRLRRETAAGKAFGFAAKLLIHPSQVAPAAEVFAPSAEERAWAERVLAAAAGGHGALTIDGRMIDKPIEDAARRILARAG